MPELQNKTPIHTWHVQQKANMALFAGFEMPLWYPTGIKAEHICVLKSAGIFDTSHMGAIAVTGQDAQNFINLCFTRDIRHLDDNRAVYGAFLNDKGHCIDDAVVYRFSKTRYLICVNAGMGAVICDHLSGRKVNPDLGKDLLIQDISDEMAKIDLQGPAAAKILSLLIPGADAAYRKLSYFSFCGSFHPVFNTKESVVISDELPVLVSRSGYTGEFGFELFVAPDKALQLWELIIDAGREHDALPCGLGARDSLRTGAGLPLSHQDIGNFPFIRHPWEIALPFDADHKNFTKQFIGSTALLQGKAEFYTLPFAGTSLRKVNPGEESRVLDQDEKEIGHVLTCATDMAIDWHQDRLISINTKNLPDGTKIKGLACGFVKVMVPLEPGEPITMTDGKRKIEGIIVRHIRPDKTAGRDIKHFL